MKYVFSLLFLVFSCNSIAQEIRPTVVVSNRSNSSYVSTIENRLKLDLERFISQKKWGRQTRDENAKLDVRYYLSVLEQNGEQYRAILMVEAFRPVFNTTYKTPLFKIIESDLTFNYQVNRPLIYNENQLNSNLLTNIAFYTYLALGYEGDSFELYGGSSYHQNANDLIARANVIDVTKIENNGKVIFGSTVKLQDLDTNKTISYKLVGQDEADIKKNLVFFKSPIGKALIGKDKGEMIAVNTPSGEKNFEILDVEYI